MDVQAEIEVGQQWQAEFGAMAEQIRPHLGRVEIRERIQRYIFGLLGRAERKNGWQLAELMYEDGRQGMQRLLNAAQWNEAGVRDAMSRYIAAKLGEPNGIFIADETGFLKKGTKSAGVARQYSGTAGRIENCQIGVFLAYATSRGCVFLDGRLYLPEEWLQDAQRCQAAGLPENTTFQTKPQLVQDMLEHAAVNAIPAQWVVADTVYSSDDLRMWLQGQGYWYVLAVPATYSIWHQGQQVSAATLIQSIAAEEWVCLSAGEGSQGPRYYDWTWLRLPYASRAGCAHWLVARRSLRTPQAVAYYHADAPATSSLTELVHIAGSRWAIEVGFEQTKAELGLDHYESRQWPTWYRHVTLVRVAYAYWVLLRAKIGDAALTIPELRRLILLLTADKRERQHRLRWVFWRRHHQAVAKACHIRRRRQNHSLEQPVPEPIPRLLSTLGELTEQTWSQIAALLPKPAHMGRPAIAHRQLLEAMLWVIHRGLAHPSRLLRPLGNRLHSLQTMAQIWPVVADCSYSDFSNTVFGCLKSVAVVLSWTLHMVG
jgi:SRSO17 transposase